MTLENEDEYVPPALTADAVLNLALLCGLDVERAEEVAAHHEGGHDMRAWLTPLLRLGVGRLRAQFNEERACSLCGSRDTQLIRADYCVTGLVAERTCRACDNTWERHF